ncbi:MAG: holo-ACP synthase [Spirochaetes bacterium]|nr:holo-ACP synthase [Spirochaetota bacterium]
MEQTVIAGIGTDIVDVRRLRRMNEEHRDRFTQKTLSQDEIALMPKSNPELFIAGRYAAKEAIVKALGYKNFSYTSINILNDGNGRPYVEDPDLLIRNRDPKESYTIHISISHEFDFAVAFVVLEKRSEPYRSTWL